jgi:hypothetical protein
MMKIHYLNTYDTMGRKKNFVFFLKPEKGDLLHGSGHAWGKGRVSTQLIFSHLLGTDMSYGFK